MKKRIKKVNLIILLITLTIALVYFTMVLIDFGFKKPIQENTENITLENNQVNLSSLTPKQKLAQMIIVRGDKKDLDFTKLNVGGIFLDRQDSEQEYKRLIDQYQENSKIKLLISTDLEGAWTPFRKNVQEYQIFPKFSEINSSEEAYEVGHRHGILLDSIGFNINFAPVAELSDSAYGGRAFQGTNQEIKEKIESYIQGLQENVLGTCKHYPGNSLNVNLHFRNSVETITQEDLDLFNTCINNDIAAIMVSHQIAEGVISSENKPSTTSPELIQTLKNFKGLIIADEINMLALKNTYPNKRELYAELINAGNNLILDFELNSRELNELLNELEIDLKNKAISQEKVDDSVRKILEMKGYKVL